MRIKDINKEKLNLTYELFMAALALVVVAILFIEFTQPISDAQARLLNNIDMAILVVFAVDYFYRLIRAEKKWVFVKQNIFDLISIMPFDKVFRLARLARLVRVARLARLSKSTRLIRSVTATRRLGNTLGGVFKTNGLLYVLLVTFAFIFFGALSIMTFEDSMTSFGDALWWSIVTTTTVGYGDIVPETMGGRIIASLLMLIGIGTLGMLTGSIATYFVTKLNEPDEAEEYSLVQKQVTFISSQLKNIEHLKREEITLINKIIVSTWEEAQKKNGNRLKKS